MGVSVIPNPNGQVVNVTNKVTFLKSVNKIYTFFYQVGSIVYYQIFFNEAFANGTIFATIDSTLKTNKQFWHMASYSNGGTTYKRVSIDGTNIKNVGAIEQGDFVSGYFIPSAT
jgi:hypothetical protein